MQLPPRMRAVRYTHTGPAAEVLERVDLPVPEPGTGEVLVAVAVSAVNPHDTKLRAGWREPRTDINIVPHGDGAGRIVAVGPEVAPSRIGERVWFFGAGHGAAHMGSAAQFTTVAAAHAARLPDTATYADGACLGIPALTAHRALFWDGPVRDQTVLVSGGAGAVGGYAIQLAKMDGATVVATVSSRAKAEFALDRGADYAVDYKTEDVVARISDITGGAGVDRIVEVDFGANVALNAKLLRSGGVIASYSSTRQPEPVFPYYDYGAKSATIHFVRDADIPESARQSAIAMITAALENGTLKHTIDSRYSLDEISAAHERQEGGGYIGKILIEVNDVDHLLENRT